MARTEPLSRKESKERTRARLLQSTLKVLHKEGPTALTTGRIAEAAGVAQPTFYVHFKGLDDALAHVAGHLAERWRRAIARNRADARQANGSLTVRALVQSYVSAILADSKAAEVFLRHRRDVTTAFGRELRRLSERNRSAIARDFARAAGKAENEVLTTSDLIFGAMLASIESVLDRRSDRDTSMDAASRMIERALASLTTAHLDSAIPG